MSIYNRLNFNSNYYLFYQNHNKIDSVISMDMLVLYVQIAIFSLNLAIKKEVASMVTYTPKKSDKPYYIKVYH